MVAANAGGAWSPIGDVTTTMLWVGGKITAYNIIVKLIIPSLMCLIIPLIYRSFKLKGKIERPAAFDKDHKQTLSLKYQSIVFFSGIGMLILVPVFKTLTHLPPFMGIMLGLGMLWIITEIIHWDKEDEIKHQYSVMHALRKVDTPSILFFFGILLSISALQATGVLKHLAEWLTATLHNDNAIVITIGLLSSIIDNVPLVAASQGMYDLSLSY